MSGVLERRYRRLMAVLPKQYRSARGEELLAVLMDKSGPTQKWPTLGEMFSLAGLGIRVRVGVEHEPGASSDRGEVLRITALLSVLLLAIGGVFGALLMIRFNAHYRLGDPRSMSHLSWWRVVGDYAQVGWVFVYVALTKGMWRTGRTLAVVLSVFAAAGVGLRISGPDPSMTLYGLVPYGVATVAVLLSFRAGAAPVRHPRRWLAGLVPAAAFVFAECGPFMPGSLRMLSNGYGSDAVVAMLLLAAAAASVQAWKSPVWPLAVAATVLGGMTPVLLLAMTSPYFNLDRFSEAMVAASFGLVVLGILSAAKRRVMRRGQVA